MNTQKTIQDSERELEQQWFDITERKRKQLMRKYELFNGLKQECEEKMSYLLNEYNKYKC